ncbi:MAG: hypothetical protein ABIH70_05630 [Chloroflexota bacterium]
MQRINGYSFYQLGNYLRPLENVRAGVTLRQVATEVWVARLWLDWFLSGSIVPVSFSIASGLALSNSLKRLVPETVQELPQEKLNAKINQTDAYSISNSLRAFQTVLNTELARSDTYYISRQGIYSTPDLIEHAEDALPPDVTEVLPDAVKLDIQQAGRCLAFGLSTAAGFHIMRAVEGVMLDYCVTFIGQKPKRKDWGSCIEELKKTDADKKVLAVLDQLRSLHRNPTMHPDEVLSNNQALTLFGIAQSAIIAMIEDQKQYSRPGPEVAQQKS